MVDFGRCGKRLAYFVISASLVALMLLIFSNTNHPLGFTRKPNFLKADNILPNRPATMTSTLQVCILIVFINTSGIRPEDHLLHPMSFMFIVCPSCFVSSKIPKPPSPNFTVNVEHKKTDSLIFIFIQLKIPATGHQCIFVVIFGLPRNRKTWVHYSITVYMCPFWNKFAKVVFPAMLISHKGRPKKDFALWDHSHTHCCLNLKLVPLALRSIQNSRWCICLIN